MRPLLWLTIFLGLGSSHSSRIPHWEEIECEAGHKYLFSEDQKPWPDAKVECELYGGWLVDIGSQEEQNCLLKFARSQELLNWWWHDGNELDEEGIYCHADGRYITWFPPKWTMIDRTVAFFDGLHALKFGTLNGKQGGSWQESGIGNAM